MSYRPPPPPPPRRRWLQPAVPWTQQPPPPGRPACVPPLPPPHPPRGGGVAGPPRFFPPGFYPRFVVPPPPPPRPPVVDAAAQWWIDTFKRTHFCSPVGVKHESDRCVEPPLRMLRRRVMQAQQLAENLKEAAMELAAVEKRLEVLLSTRTADNEGVEAPRLRVQRERKLATCEGLKTELEEMNAAGGLLPEKQLKQIQAFAARVNKKKAYRKRAKLRRRAEASIRRAVDSNANEGATEKAEEAIEVKASATQESALSKELPDDEPGASWPHESSNSSPPDRISSPWSLDPGTLTIDTLIAVRRAWDAYIVFPHTMGASTIPPHFVPPPPTPTAQWAVYATSSGIAN